MLGLGAAWYEREHLALVIPCDSVSPTVQQLWRDDRDFKGSSP